LTNILNCFDVETDCVTLVFLKLNTYHLTFYTVFIVDLIIYRLWLH